MAAGFKTATVNASEIPSTQTDFPAYIDLSRLGITTLAEAESVRVYADEARTTEWAREIVSVAVMRVKVPSLTSTVAAYVYWDGVSSDYAVTDTYGAQNAWTNGFVGVWHLGESSGSAKDSTGNNDGTYVGNLPNAVAGLAGDAQHGDGSGSYVTTADLNGNWAGANGQVSFSFLVNFDSNIVHGIAGDRGTTESIYLRRLTSSHGRNLQLLADGVGSNVNRARVNASLNENTWYHVMAIWDETQSASAKWSCYIDGASKTMNYQNTVDVALSNTSNTFYIMDRGDAAEDLDGKMSTFRIHDGVRSADWAAIESSNDKDEANFWGTWSTIATNAAKSIAGVSNV